MAGQPPDVIQEGDYEVPRAIRLTFSYVGSRIELISAEQLIMFVPPSDPMERGSERSGFWFELRGGNDEPLFRRIIAHPIETDREVFPENATDEIVREPVKDPKGVFSIVIPEISAARTLSFVGSPSESSRRHYEPAREIERFSISEVIRRATQEHQ